MLSFLCSFNIPQNIIIRTNNNTLPIGIQTINTYSSESQHIVIKHIENGKLQVIPIDN